MQSLIPDVRGWLSRADACQRKVGTAWYSRYHSPYRLASGSRKKSGGSSQGLTWLHSDKCHLA